MRVICFTPNGQRFSQYRVIKSSFCAFSLRFCRDCATMFPINSKKEGHRMTFVSTKKLEKPIPEGMSPQKAPCGTAFAK